MSIAQQAIAMRRKARQDERYAGQRRRDAQKRAERLKRQIASERLRAQRGKAQG